MKICVERVRRSLLSCFVYLDPYINDINTDNLIFIIYILISERYKIFQKYNLSYKFVNNNISC